jgi:hypothetical protein
MTTELKKVCNELEDCASLAACHHEWASALFEAIQHYSAQADNKHEDMSASDRITIGQLAAIGIHLLDDAWSNAKDAQDKAKAFAAEESEKQSATKIKEAA